MSVAAAAGDGLVDPLAAELLESRLGGVQGRGFAACCPVMQDRNALVALRQCLAGSESKADGGDEAVGMEAIVFHCYSPILRKYALRFVPRGFAICPCP